MELTFIGVLETLLAIICYIFLRRLGNRDGLPTNWPVVGMLPALLSQIHRIYDWVTDLLSKSNCNFHFRGPWFSTMNIMVTADPTNIHHIMTSNFSNFPKGSEFRSMFDILGDGIFNADETWRDQRKVAMSLITHRHFLNFLARTSMEKVGGALIPLLNHISETESVVDLQDIFQRYTFDSICKLVTGFDPCCLSSEFPEVPFATALDDAEEAIFYRHVVPELVWKIQKWLGVGVERNLSRAWRTFDSVTEKYIAAKREEMRKGEELRSDDNEGTDLLTSYINSGYNDNRYLRDTIVNLLLAGRDTTGSALTWFFWNLSKHPLVVKKIREEIKSIETTKEINYNSINKMVYLHGAICESLRLYPPVPWEHKRSVKPDILPSGHHVDPTMRIVFSLYAMGRMCLVWGEDCLEFRPERWIMENKGIKHEPSYKFMAFNAGPRTCLGKEVAFTQMKIVAANIIKRFDIEVVNGHEVKPCASIILYMKNGLKVKVTKRDN